MESELKKIAKEGEPKDSDNAQSTASATGDEDLCAGAGYKISETYWYLTDRQSHWEARLGLRNNGPGICDRQTDWKALAQRVPPKLAGNNSIPVPWEQVEKALSGVRHAFASPRGDWIVVLTRNKIHFVPLNGGALGKGGGSADIPFGNPVMARWAVGRYVGLWTKQLSAIPPPHDNVLFAFDGEN